MDVSKKHRIQSLEHTWNFHVSILWCSFQVFPSSEEIVFFILYSWFMCFEKAHGHYPDSYLAILWPRPDCNLTFWSILLATLFVKCPFGAMSCKVKLNTLQGSVITLDVRMTATVRELKTMLLEKNPCQDPIERKILGVVLLRNSSIIEDAEPINAPEFLGVEPLGPSNCNIHKERSGSRSKTWHRCAGMFWGEDPLERDQYFWGCLQKLTSTSFAQNPGVCDSHWEKCLSRLRLSG